VQQTSEAQGVRSRRTSRRAAALRAPLTAASDGKENDPVRGGKDPDFFSVVESAAAILAGLQAAVWLYGRLPQMSPRKKTLRVLREMADLVRYVEVDLRVIREVVSEAQISGGRLYRPGRRAFLSDEQFARYDRTTDRLLARLRRIVKATNRILRDVPPDSPDETINTALGDAAARFERILNDRNQTIDDVLRDLTDGVRSLRAALHTLLPGEPAPDDAAT
jgi:hypothetical protein